MCLAVPARIAVLDRVAETASVVLGGITKEISLALIEEVAVGDYVLVHVGYALARIDPEEAERTLAQLAEAGVLPPGPAGEEG